MRDAGEGDDRRLLTNWPWSGRADHQYAYPMVVDRSQSATGDRVELYSQAICHALEQAKVDSASRLLLVRRVDGSAQDSRALRWLVDRWAPTREVRLIDDEHDVLGAAKEGSPVYGAGVLVALGPMLGAAPPYRVRLWVYSSTHTCIGGTYVLDRLAGDWAVTGVEDPVELD